MEKDKEIAKLVRILPGIARADRLAAWREPQPDVVGFSIAQFNKVLTRLLELEPDAAHLFSSLPEHATLEMARMAAHDLSAYFTDESEDEHRHHGRRHGRHEGFRFRGCGLRVTAVPMGGRCG
jgi:hypothetical protein